MAFTNEELIEALKNAEKAGRVADAQRLAAELNKRRMEVGLPSAVQDRATVAQGMSTAERALAGAGQAVDSRIRGVKQLFGMVSPEEVDRAKAIDQELFAAGPAGTVGKGLAELGLTYPLMALPGAQTIPGGAAIGGILGGTQEVGTGDSRAFNVLGGAGAGALGSAFVQNLMPFRPEVDDLARAGVLSWAKDKKLPMSFGQMSGNPAGPGSTPTLVQRMEKQMAPLPGASGFYDTLQREQQAGVRNEVRNIIGGDPNEMYRAFGEGKSVKFDKPFFDELRKIKGSFKEITKPDDPTSAYRTVEELLSREAPGTVKNPLGVMFGRNAPQKDKVTTELPMIGPKDDFNNVQALRSLYAQRAYSATDKVDKAAYRKIRDALDNLVERNFPGGEYKNIRQAYQVEAMLRKARDTDTGNYDPQKIASILNKIEQEDPGTIKALGGRGEALRKLQAAAPYLKPPNSSGTAENLLASKMVTLGLLSGGTGGVGTYLTTGDPTSALIGAAGALGGAYAAPALVNRALQSRTTGILGNRVGEAVARNPSMPISPMGIRMLEGDALLRSAPFAGFSVLNQ